MKLVFVAVSLIVVLRVDCRSSQPEPDPQHLGIDKDDEWPEPDSLRLDIAESSKWSESNSQHPDIAEDPEWPESDSQHPDIAEDPEWPKSDSQPPDIAEDPQWTEPDLSFGPFTTVDTTSEADSDISEPDWSNFEEESRQSDSESRKGGCKVKNACANNFGSCVSNITQCKGKYLPGGCKGAGCYCCIPACPEGFFFLPANTSQCFKLFEDQRRNWTQSYTKCRQERLIMPRIYSDDMAINLQNYIRKRFKNNGRETWLGAKGSGSSVRWIRDNVIIPSNITLWRSYSTSTSSCLDIRSYFTGGKPYFMDACSHNHHYAMCELYYK